MSRPRKLPARLAERRPRREARPRQLHGRPGQLPGGTATQRPEQPGARVAEHRQAAEGVAPLPPLLPGDQQLLAARADRAQRISGRSSSAVASHRKPTAGRPAERRRATSAATAHALTSVSAGPPRSPGCCPVTTTSAPPSQAAQVGVHRVAPAGVGGGQRRRQRRASGQGSRGWSGKPDPALGPGEGGRVQGRPGGKGGDRRVTGDYPPTLATLGSGFSIQLHPPPGRRASKRAILCDASSARREPGAAGWRHPGFPADAPGSLWHEHGVRDRPRPRQGRAGERGSPPAGGRVRAPGRTVRGPGVHEPRRRASRPSRPGSSSRP